jgi:preprotein translocase SecE subunit
VARDRKRAKQRRERQARAAGTTDRRVERRAAPAVEHDEPLSHEHEPPELASGDLDLADAQLALGRPELADAAPSQVPDVDEDSVDLPELADEEQFEELEDEVDATEERFEAGSNGEGGAEALERVERVRRATVARPQEGNRFANFLRGSWRELERVQWPDRHQVFQATAVVIGFVIVAGAFLGLMDYVAGKIVDLIV